MKRLLFCLPLLAMSCARETDLAPALNSITAAGLLDKIRTLSSDQFEGRAPGSAGANLTVAYLESQFRQAGLQPGNPDGTYIQKVPLVGIQTTSTASFTVNGKAIAMTPRKDYIVGSRRFVQDVPPITNSPVVFVGYGVVAPEYGWDDYKGADMTGKTMLMLVNDPAVPDPNDASKLDENMFKGRAMTYYGRWTYKYEIASKKHAAAAIIVHETGPAGYPFEVVVGSMGRENFEIQRSDGNIGRVDMEGWMTADKVRDLFNSAGKNFDDAKKAAVRKDFQPVDLGVQASFTAHNRLRTIDSRNVIARLEGSDAQRKNEYLIYTAHWDHLGRDASLSGDQIYNGAIDNASGTAALLEIAQAYKKLQPAPKRSILFLSVTAEEKGLLGARYYAEHPLYPLKQTVADINMDGVNQWGRTRDLVVVGKGNSTLDDVAADVAKTQGRTLTGDAEPEKGHFYRSDHFEFAKQGVPALDTESGIDYIGKAAGYGTRKRQEYTANDYHKVTDEIKPDWDLSGAIEDLRLLFQVGNRVAQEPRFPEWSPKTEFKSKRDEMLK